MNQNKLDTLSKKFCEKTMIGFSDEIFILLAHVGEEETAYALTPKHMKALSQSMAHNVSEFEKKFGTINSDWKPDIQSPFPIK